MSNIINQKAWFLKYQPKEIKDYVFNSDSQEKDVNQWIEDGIIPGNLLLYGPPGCGKTSMAELLIHKLITKASNVKIIKSRSVSEIDNLYTWVQRKPSGTDKRKIIYIEEFDRLSIQALNQLKDSLLEKFGDHVSFIACTNYINKIPSPILQRFTYKYEMTSINKEGILNRIIDILKEEEVSADLGDLTEFINKNYKSGLRTIINDIQINVINKNIDFKNITNLSSNNDDSIENKVVSIIINIFDTGFKTTPTNRKKMYTRPMDSIISSEYSELVELIQFNYNINWEEIYMMLYDKINFLPIIQIIEKYINSLEHKKIQHIHFMAFLAEGLDAMVKINI